MPAARVTWLSSLFLLGYVGIEVGLGGWIVTFMIRVRQADRFASGMTATGFWLGLTIGRVILGFVTGKIGEKLAISVSPYHCLFLERHSDLHNRSIFQSQWVWSSCSGSFRSFMSARYQSVCWGSSSDRSFPLQWLLARNCFRSTCTFPASDLQQLSEEVEVRYSRMLSVPLRRRRASKCYNLSSWLCWLLSSSCGYACLE